jgi:type III pantothenate kinase
MILECDVGNSRCKWRLRDGVNICDRGSYSHHKGELLLPSLKAVDRVLVACVAKAEHRLALAERLAPLAVNIEYAEVKAAQCGVRCGYDNPKKLGVDRWLAVVAAFKSKQGAVLVLDAGSALTVDVVDQSGGHLGGYISPGAGLMKSSLLADTGNVRFDRQSVSSGIGFGVNTQEAVNTGVLAAQLGVIEVAIAEAKRRIPQDFAILLTGGDGQLLLEHLPKDVGRRVELLPELVLDGLQWLLP